ncbi:MAG: DedA family protein [Burkholderiales bacterium]|nr:DedA family protein [Burkholderiales bacterium]
MELIQFFWELLVHLDDRLFWLAQNYGTWIYLILFLIVFCETGLVVTPFLPGDSLLFVAGTIAAAGEMNVHLMAGLLILAAILGDSLNYAIGHFIGPKVFRYNDSWFFRKSYVERTHAFFQRHGGKTIVIARFMPIVRTYAPFVAGIGRMEYGRFLFFNVIGAVVWVVLLTYAGYFFGNLPVIKDNLSLVILMIIFLSILPGIVEVLRHRLRGSSQ